MYKLFPVSQLDKCWFTAFGWTDPWFIKDKNRKVVFLPNCFELWEDVSVNLNRHKHNTCLEEPDIRTSHYHPFLLCPHTIDRTKSETFFSCPVAYFSADLSANNQRSYSSQPELNLLIKGMANKTTAGMSECVQSEIFIIHVSCNTCKAGDIHHSIVFNPTTFHFICNIHMLSRLYKIRFSCAAMKHIVN